MTYIFLDIDGVLTTRKQMNMNSGRYQATHLWAKEMKVLYPFDPECVNVLNHIIKDSDCDIILSSDWKKFWNLNELNIIFNKFGVEKSPKDVTANFIVSVDDNIGLEKNRAAQISEYIESHNIEDFIVLDDLDISKFMNPKYADRIFLTNDKEGLKQTSLKEKIIRRIHTL